MTRAIFHAAWLLSVVAFLFGTLQAWRGNWPSAVTLFLLACGLDLHALMFRRGR
jgi:hypothetical protein